MRMDRHFDKAYGTLRRRLWLRRTLEAAAIAMVVAAGAALYGLPPVQIAIAGLVAMLPALVGLGFLPRYRTLSPAAFAEHLDRRFPSLEESTRLVLALPDALGPLQALQRHRVLDALPAALADQQTWLPAALRGATLAVLAGAGAVVLLAAPLRGILDATVSVVTGEQDVRTADDLLASVEVHIEPPAYTGLDARVSDSLDLELPEGSTVRWRLALRSAGAYALLIGDDERLPLAVDDDGAYTAETRIDRTSLYRIIEEASGSDASLDGIYTLSVTLDRPPRLRIVDPDTSVLEVERDGTPRFTSEVIVRDDFGVGNVEIRASVAKGSGEGVKFRDEAFDFDSASDDDAGDAPGKRLERSWNLEALGMEPGDEVYFFVVAEDNRKPEPNEARSDTVVVRWLDEAPPPVMAGDIAISVMPDYYKSQRQIIIETEQLIADRDLLEPETFDATSRALGDAQAELRNRYGQYLGDEFGESADGEVELPDMAAEFEAHDDHEHHEHDGHDHGDHDDVGASAAATFGDGTALVAQFTHTHEASDIGPVSARNPVGLLKRSVAAMWDSELHLRLSDPSTALPFQYEALNYYNRAREADRIYTRRLGFEPPPVSEDRRLTGDIRDVESQRVEASGAQTAADKHLFRALFERLSTRAPDQPFDAEEIDLLQRAASRLQAQSAERPALIRQAAALEQLRLAGQPSPAGCDDCLATATSAAWSAVSSAHARPQGGVRPDAADDAMARDYAGLESPRD